MDRDNQFQAEPVEVAAAFLFMALEALLQADRDGCLDVAHRLDMNAMRQRDKSVQNAYLRAADACRHIAVSKEPGAVVRWKATRHNSDGG